MKKRTEGTENWVERNSETLRDIDSRTGVNGGAKSSILFTGTQRWNVESHRNSGKTRYCRVLIFKCGHNRSISPFYSTFQPSCAINNNMNGKFMFTSVRLMWTWGIPFVSNIAQCEVIIHWTQSWIDFSLRFKIEVTLITNEQSNQTDAVVDTIAQFLVNIHLFLFFLIDWNAFSVSLIFPYELMEKNSFFVVCINNAYV